MKPYGNPMPKKALRLPVTRKDFPRKDPCQVNLSPWLTGSYIIPCKTKCIVGWGCNAENENVQLLKMSQPLILLALLSLCSS